MRKKEIKSTDLPIIVYVYADDTSKDNKKGTVHPRPGHKGTRWGLVVNTTPWPLYPREIPGTHRGPQGRSGQVQKILPPLDDTGTCILMQQVCK